MHGPFFWLLLWGSQDELDYRNLRMSSRYGGNCAVHIPEIQVVTAPKCPAYGNSPIKSKVKVMGGVVNSLLNFFIPRFATSSRDCV